ncbi:hypothetical protein PAMP_007192 [Pampus punctatissimus]
MEPTSFHAGPDKSRGQLCGAAGELSAFDRCFHPASGSAPIGSSEHHVAGQSRAFQEPVRKKKNKTNPRELQQRVDSIDNGALIPPTQEHTRGPTRSKTYALAS